MKRGGIMIIRDYIERNATISGAASRMTIESDAKRVFRDYLLESTCFETVNESKEPADIIAYKNGVEYYYEIKSTSVDLEERPYFGSASFTEWRQAFKTPDNYYFVIAQFKKSRRCKFRFYIFTPNEFKEYSSIPPIVVFFNLNMNRKTKAKINGRSSLRLSEDVLDKLDSEYKKCKEQQNAKYKSGE